MAEVEHVLPHISTREIPLRNDRGGAVDLVRLNLCLFWWTRACRSKFHGESIIGNRETYHSTHNVTQISTINLMPFEILPVVRFIREVVE